MKEALNQTQLAARLKVPHRQQVTEKIKRQPLFYQSVIIKGQTFPKYIHGYKIVREITTNGNEISIEMQNPCELIKTSKNKADIVLAQKDKEEEYYKLPSGYKFLKI